MSRKIKYIVIIVVCVSGIFAMNAGYPVLQTDATPPAKISAAMTGTAVASVATSERTDPAMQEPVIPDDTIAKPRIPVKKTVPETYDDLLQHSASDLRDPENLETEVEYDLHSGTYLIRSRIGDFDLGTPLRMTPKEYQDYTLRQSLNNYFRERNKVMMDSLGIEKKEKNQFNLMDMSFDIAGVDKLFGPGGVRLKSQGTVGMGLGLKTNKTKNPALPVKSRNRTFFNFDTDVQMNMRASVGTKINFDMNYNTEASFDFDAAKLKLGYSGEEDEILKSLEGGNVSLQTNNSLIRGGAALFGIKTDLQFGKLRVRGLLAQQESESRTISSKGGSQMNDFEITIDSYDENRHYFLAHYFRDTYDKAMAKLPYIASGISISRVEVWITNKVSSTGQTRNIVGFADLGEYEHISNPLFTPSGRVVVPYNEANTLYSTIIDQYPGARDISTVSQTFEGYIEGGKDYEKVESARMLSPSEYTLNAQLGYISLNMKLQTDEVLAVAFEYTYNGTVYQVGEFSSDKTDETNKCLFLKVLKGTSLSPSMPFWDLMMKNIYAIPNAYSIQKTKFRMDVVYQSDTAGTYVYTIPEGNIKDQTLLKVMNLDRLNSNNEAVPDGKGDGFFDYVEGFTIVSGNGRLIFPVVEPFGSHLRDKIGNNVIAEKYVYQELYDSTLTVAKQIAEKNKFLLRGQFTGSSPNVFNLGATNVARGSVVVRANGIILQEGTDYEVNYSMGTVTINNENLISSNASISVSLENQSTYSTQRKTMFGADLNYDFSKNFNVGTTIMHLSEMPLTTKTSFGDESVKNTLWGVNMNYKTESQWITNMFDKLPLLSLSAPSSLSLNAEFAHLIAGHYENKYTGGYSYLDDFESTKGEFDLLNPYNWNISSTPYDNNPATALFPEAGLVNNIDYGKNRAMMAWYFIDGIFTRKNSSLRPSYMTLDDISKHEVRAVEIRELFPDRDQLFNENSFLNILNLAYYPNERGPYNLDGEQINSDGSLQHPEKRWGGIMRSLDQTDFETANIQYIEFWVMDPFIDKPNAKGGDLYFNLGEISEDILKDEKKFFENGLPVIESEMSQVDTTVWGKVPKQQSTVYAFDNTPGTRRLQDVGFNGLSSLEEQTFPAYAEFLRQLRERLSPEALALMEKDRFSPFEDPAGDNFSYFRTAEYDRDQADILTRYKRYNGVEGNSQESDGSQTFGTSSKILPDVEDFNKDNTLNENEKYYQYRVSLRPEDMVVGMNYIVDKRVSKPTLMNGETPEVTWYQFKIPVRSYDHKVGSISDFSSIRFMRTFMTGFAETTILRFGKFALVRGDWRPYQQALYKSDAMPAVSGTMSVSTVNIEENSDRQPVNYTLPPGVTRITDPSQPQLRQQNEQSLSLKIENLASQDARAVYKRTSYDLRRYRRMELFVHAEKLVDDVTNLENEDLTVFMRLGTDYKNNYYEYEVPLTLTAHKPPGASFERLEVWPDENKMNIRLEALTDLKLERNREKSMGGGVTYGTEYSKNDPDNTRNTMTIVGNPTLSDVQVVMIGVRNRSREIKSAEVWVNELRVTDFDESGGWAANANMNLAISDFATVNATGNIETAGFGGLEQSISERSLDDYRRFSIATTVQLGKFFPEKTNVRLPMYFSYSKEVISPEYNPLDQDILLQESINNETTSAGKDSIRNFANDVYTTKSFALNNVNVGIRSKSPMPYDPANFSMGFSSNTEERTNPETEYETTKSFQGNLGYMYAPYVKPLSPFAKVEKNSGATKYIKQLAFNYLPSSLSFQNSLSRNYYEIQLRDLNDSGLSGFLPVSFSQNFYWDRSFDIRWNPLNNLGLQLTTNTNARIEEGYLQANKQQNPDDYERWKDTVMKSIRDLGTPLLYDQTFSVTYTPPFALIPILDWISGSATYRATYNWERGSYIDDETNIGNSIKNQRSFDYQGNLNFVQLYNRSDYLKEVLRKSNARNATQNQPTKKTQKKKPVEMEVTLSPDSGVIVQHNMLTKKVLITARRKDDSTRYKVSFKALDYARVRITNRDSVTLKLSIRPAPPKEETFVHKLGEYSARTLMMIRRANFQYTKTDGMYLPGFAPEIGNWFGQGSTAAGRAPGWGFAFGDVRRSFINDVADRGWLIYNADNITPAMINASTQVTGSVQLEPLPGFKIDLSANYIDSRDTEIRYMYEGMPETRSGNYSITTIGLGGFLRGVGNAKKGYKSDVFQEMLDNRDIIAGRIQERYTGQIYPDAGFLSETNYKNTEYNPNNGAIGLNSGDVIIPAFIAAYTNKNPQKVGLTAFPSLGTMLPNWRISYDGLTKLPAVSKHFKSFTLQHRYNCVYNVGSYTSYLNYVNAGIGGDLGYVRNTETGAPIPSMGYEIASVTLTESFNPLFGVDATLLNNITAGTKFSKNRTINLNVTAYQLVEAHTNDVTISLGYKYAEFNKILKIKKKNDFSSDLTVRMDYTYRKALSLIRKLEDGYTQATQGTISQMFQFSADYAISRKVTLRGFYDLQINEPLVSSSAFPTSNSNYGVSIQISLSE